MEWSFSPLTAIVIFLVLMFFGYGFGLFEGRNQGYKKRREEERDEKPARASLESDSTLGQGPPAPGLLRLSQDDRGDLRLEMDNQSVDTSAMTSDQRRRLIELLTVMRPWLEGKPAASPSASPSSRPASPPAPRPAPAPPAQRMPGSQPASGPASPPVPPTADKEDEESAAPQSMVIQIDGILQSRMAGTPLEEKGVRLQESLQGGVLVWVGLDKFEAIDDVPDDEIKQAIRAAIAEWEKKYTPGL